MSSDCPFPSTPAIPTTSPCLTVKSNPFTASMPRLSLTTKSLMTKASVVGFDGAFSVLNETERPTIISANSWSVTLPISTVPITLPRRITVQRSATAWISLILWVIKKIDFPSLVNCFMMTISSSIS